MIVLSILGVLIWCFVGLIVFINDYAGTRIYGILKFHDGLVGKTPWKANLFGLGLIMIWPLNLLLMLYHKFIRGYSDD